MNDSLAIEAMNLADGTDIHDVAGLVAVYRSLIREGCDGADVGRDLRCYVVRKRIELEQVRLSPARAGSFASRR